MVQRDADRRRHGSGEDQPKATATATASPARLVPMGCDYEPHVVGYSMTVLRRSAGTEYGVAVLFWDGMAGKGIGIFPEDS